MGSKKLNPYLRIMQAGEAVRTGKGYHGVNLTAEECYYLSRDSAIEQVATNLEEGDPVENGGYRMTKYGFEDIPHGD